MKEDFYPHNLSRQEARARIQALTAYWDWRYHTHTTWDGYTGEISGKVLGIRFRGVVHIEERQLHGQLMAGFLGERLGGRQYLLRKLNDYMDPRHTLDELWARVRTPGRAEQPA